MTELRRDLGYYERHSLPSRYWEPGWEDAEENYSPEECWMEDEPLPFD